MAQPTAQTRPSTPAGGGTPPPMSDEEHDIYALAAAVGGKVFKGEGR